jgi:integrase/recombinase XerD
MNWDIKIKEFSSFLKLEKSLSRNSLDAYIHDIIKFTQFLEYFNYKLSPEEIKLNHLKEFIEWVNKLGMEPRSQARIISGIKSFYKFLLLNDEIENDPTALIESPKIGRKLPVFLSIEEIDLLIKAIDLSKPEGQRNKAMIETLYSCGLRVSELVDLKITNLYFDLEFIKVFGKGSKERLVPIGKKAVKEIQLYLKFDRNKIKVNKDSENIVFLNRRGRKLTRVMIFTIIKNLAKKIELEKNIGPHTFRHSFATHLMDGGADLRAIQEMLGHESITTTEIYTHLDREYLRDTILRFHPRS